MIESVKAPSDDEKVGVPFFIAMLAVMGAGAVTAGIAAIADTVAGVAPVLCSDLSLQGTELGLLIVDLGLHGVYLSLHIRGHLLSKYREGTG